MGKSTPLMIHDSLVLAMGKNLLEKRRKAEMNLGSAGSTACATKVLG